MELGIKMNKLEPFNQINESELIVIIVYTPTALLHQTELPLSWKIEKYKWVFQYDFQVVNWNEMK